MLICCANISGTKIPAPLLKSQVGQGGGGGGILGWMQGGSGRRDRGLPLLFVLLVCCLDKQSRIDLGRGELDVADRAAADEARLHCRHLRIAPLVGLHVA
eukprot:TRINITY_DN66199_c0_g1_i1.p1 TRINITY_DN66199_c0_g1~~TRINITY_DN66199_c0_g1_i1.p1  ORF type:complete len:100 (-),score=0.06 TRINITY_DN66199_c0_g1_i1:279-578(-)